MSMSEHDKDELLWKILAELESVDTNRLASTVQRLSASRAFSYEDTSFLSKLHDTITKVRGLMLGSPPPDWPVNRNGESGRLSPAEGR